MQKRFTWNSCPIHARKLSEFFDKISLTRGNVWEYKTISPIRFDGYAQWFRGWRVSVRKGTPNTMSAAPAIVAETPHYLDAPTSDLEAPVSAPTADALLCELVHELRQPLSSIEAIAYYLEMTLPANQFQMRQYMSQVQQLVEETNAILKRSVGTERKPCSRAASASAQ
jgi:hypothetical protein